MWRACLKLEFVRGEIRLRHWWSSYINMLSHNVYAWWPLNARTFMFFFLFSPKHPLIVRLTSKSNALSTVLTLKELFKLVGSSGGPRLFFDPTTHTGLYYPEAFLTACNISRLGLVNPNPNWYLMFLLVLGGQRAMAVVVVFFFFSHKELGSIYHWRYYQAKGKKKKSRSWGMCRDAF